MMYLISALSVFGIIGGAHALIFGLLERRVTLKQYAILLFLWPVFYTEKSWERIEATWYAARPKGDK